MSTTLVIDRSKWYRGRGTFTSSLLTTIESAGCVGMCCLGFYCKQEGFTDEQIREIDIPEKLFWEKCPSTNVYKISAAERFPWLHKMAPDADDYLYGETRVEYLIVRINDDRTISDAYRELLLAGMFKTYGDIDLQFVGEGYPWEVK